MNLLPETIHQGEVVLPHKRPLVGFRLLSKLCAATTALCNAQVKRGTKDAVHITGRNLIIEIAESGSGNQNQNPAPSSPNMIRCLVIQVHDDYTTCEQLDGSGNIIEVAKPYAIRRQSYDYKDATKQNIFNRLDGAHLYTYANSSQRTDTLLSDQGQPTYREYIWPEYVIGETVIFAVPCDQTNVVDDQDANIKVNYQEIDARGWAYADTVCVNGVQKNILIVGSLPFGSVIH